MATNPLTPRVNNIETGGTWKIGDVKQSFLTEAEFQAEHDDTWVLCDGRDVIGSDYAILKEGDAITSHNIPDARGQFLRGLDVSGTVDPDGAGRVVGDSQADAMQNHAHASNVYHDKWGNNGGGEPNMGFLGAAGTGNKSLTSYNSQVSVAIGGRQASESRPKNLTCNMFIKINREPSA